MRVAVHLARRSGLSLRVQREQQIRVVALVRAAPTRSAPPVICAKSPPAQNALPSPVSTIDAHVVGGARVVERPEELVHHLRADRVAALRVGQRDRLDAAVARDA